MATTDKQKRISQRLKEIKERGILYREATVSAIDQEARTVELSFSSETETVERWFGIEVLGHGPGECDLTRLNNKAPALWMHDWTDQRGVILPGTARIDTDRKGRCKVQISRSEDGEELFQDLVDGVITKVSVGYDVTGMRLEEERDGVDIYRVTNWLPYEISFVSIAADESVGVGRTPEKPHEETGSATGEDLASIKNAAETTNFLRTETTMHEKILRDGQGNLVRAKLNEDGTIAEVLEVLEKAGEATAAATARGMDAERSRIRSISDMGKEYGKPELASEFIREGKSPDEFRSALLADFAKERAQTKPLAEQEKDANIGMTDKDLKRYSLMKVVRALANPSDTKAQKDAAFEFECSLTAARQFGKEARGIIVPPDVLAKRSFNAGSNGQTSGQTGANLVATELMAGSFIEMLRNRTTIMRLGTVLAGLVGNVEIPKQTGGATAYWLGEGEDAQEGTPSIGQIGLSPKTVAAYTDISRRLSMQSTPDAEGIVVRDLRNAMSQAIDLAGYYGTGQDKQPKGIKNYTGINAVDFATAGKPTFAELVQMETEVSADNADVDQMGYVGNARFRGWCKTTTKFGANTSTTIWEPGNTVNGYRTEITNQVANGDVFFGNFADLVIALWGGLDMTVDPYSLSKSGGIRIVLFQDVDFVLRRVESLCYGSDTVTP